MTGAGPHGPTDRADHDRGGRWTLQVVSAGQPPTRTVSLATSGASFTATDTCRDSRVIEGRYSATASTLVIVLNGGTDDAGGRTVVETFEKQ